MTRPHLLANRCVKPDHIRSFSNPYFPAFELNTERYSVFLCIQSEYGKYGPEKFQIGRSQTNLATFSVGVTY